MLDGELNSFSLPTPQGMPDELYNSATNLCHRKEHSEIIIMVTSMFHWSSGITNLSLFAGSGAWRGFDKTTSRLCFLYSYPQIPSELLRRVWRYQKGGRNLLICAYRDRAELGLILGFPTYFLFLYEFIFYFISVWPWLALPQGYCV